MLAAFTPMADRALQTDLLPDAMHSLVIHLQSVTPEQGQRSPVTIALVPPGDLPQPLCQSAIVSRVCLIA